MINPRKHRALPPSRLRVAVGAAALLLMLAACVSTGGGSSLSGEGRAVRLAQNGDHAGAAGVYIGLATNAVGSDADRLTMLAIEQWLEGGDIGRARNAHSRVATPSSGPLYWLWAGNSAALALYQGDSEAALSLLEALSREPLTQDRRLRVEELRADAYFQSGDPGRAAELMLQRELWLSSRDDVDANRRHLWEGLAASRPSDLRTASELTADTNIRAWLSLGSLAASTGQQGIGWANGVARWREANPDHPAIAIVDGLELPDEQLLSYPRQVALLLPLSGNAASAGKAIQNGFLGAYFATAGGLDDRQTIRVYDVNKEGGAVAAYTAAVADGAEFVVGPLLRRNVSELANDLLVPIPVLTLNYLPENTLAPPGLFQFALAPEDEAEAAAERALADGHTRALALVPSNSVGRRVLLSFASRFEELGGTLLDSRSYTSENPDFSNTIEDLMALSGSVQRYQRLRANIGGPLQFDPRRRQDAEFIFLAANAASGRLLKSQLKFHYSGDLPVYSTSSIYAMDGRTDSDLNGVMFVDAPWVISPQPWIERLPGEFEEHWPEQRRLGRLHAMGYDAYHLVGALFGVPDGAFLDMDGATGRLFVDAEGRVHRRPAWAQFQGGRPVAIADSLPASGPIRDVSEDGRLAPPESTDREPWLDEANDESPPGQ